MILEDVRRANVKRLIVCLDPDDSFWVVHRSVAIQRASSNKFELATLRNAYPLTMWEIPDLDVPYSAALLYGTVTLDAAMEKFDKCTIVAHQLTKLMGVECEDLYGLVNAVAHSIVKQSRRNSCGPLHSKRSRGLSPIASPKTPLSESPAKILKRTLTNDESNNSETPDFLPIRSKTPVVTGTSILSPIKSPPKSQTPHFAPLRIKSAAVTSSPISSPNKSHQNSSYFEECGQRLDLSPKVAEERPSTRISDSPRPIFKWKLTDSNDGNDYSQTPDLAPLRSKTAAITSSPISSPNKSHQNSSYFEECGQRWDLSPKVAEERPSTRISDSPRPIFKWKLTDSNDGNDYSQTPDLLSFCSGTSSISSPIKSPPNSNYFEECAQRL